MISTRNGLLHEGAGQESTFECRTPYGQCQARRDGRGRWIDILVVGALLWGALPAVAQRGSSVSSEVSSGPGRKVSAITEGKTEDEKAERMELPDAPVPAGTEPATAPSTAQPAGTASAVSGYFSSSVLAGLLEFDGPAGNEGPETVAGAETRSASGLTNVELKDCPYDKTHARECRMHWKQMLISSALYNAFENGGNLYTGYFYRTETSHGKWWDRTIASAADWRWDHWSDDNPALDDYVAHPMMGAITNGIWIQNDPRGMTLEFANNRAYWRSRLRAMAWSTFYSFEWKLGPFGEAGFGHNGDHYFTDKGVLTNETGWVELVTTPVGGLGWTLAEDYLDKHVVRALEEKSRNPLLLTTYQFLTPARGVANILRFRPPWYRDGRIVKAQSFWSDPGEGLSASAKEALKYAPAQGDREAAVSDPALVLPQGFPGSSGWEGPGGRHEFGAWWGLSLMSGHIWGFAKDVKYMPIDLRYSYEFYRRKRKWAVRYSPEITALALLDWPTPNTTGNLFNQRTRVYGSGVSPVGFQWDFLPLRKVQPFFSTDGGMIYFVDRVLSPQGSQFMYTVDFGGGFNIFKHRNQALTLGYRYGHLSNANISLHNPGTDANTFYVGVSRFSSQTTGSPGRLRLPHLHGKN
jgi:hypothetical protein